MDFHIPSMRRRRNIAAAPWDVRRPRGHIEARAEVAKAVPPSKCAVLHGLLYRGPISRPREN